jgi:F-type H+-transporting ATPase subunit epsilon
MATSLKVTVVTPERSEFTGTATEVILPAWNGELGVLPDHDTLLCLLHAGVCRIVTSEGTLRFVVGRGFADIGPDRVTLLTETFVAAEAVDKAQAQRDFAEAELAITQHEPETEKRRQAELAYEHARARLSA